MQDHLKLEFGMRKLEWIEVGSGKWIEFGSGTRRRHGYVAASMRKAEKRQWIELGMRKRGDCRRSCRGKPASNF